jgi:hypothetical protein
LNRLSAVAHKKAPCGVWHVTLELRLVGYLSDRLSIL